jgi:hypothetical protein
MIPEVYAADLGLGGTYGHSFKECMADECMKFEFVHIKDGVTVGTDGALYWCWKVKDSAYDPDISGSMTHTHYLRLKHVYKLCNNDKAPKKGEQDFDPAYKHDYIYKCLIWNLDAITEWADLDLTGNDNQGYGESGTCLVCKICNKPNVDSGQGRTDCSAM